MGQWVETGSGWVGVVDKAGIVIVGIVGTVGIVGKAFIVGKEAQPLLLQVTRWPRFALASSTMLGGIKLCSEGMRGM